MELLVNLKQRRSGLLATVLQNSSEIRYLDYILQVYGKDQSDIDQKDQMLTVLKAYCKLHITRIVEKDKFIKKILIGLCCKSNQADGYYYEIHHWIEKRQSSRPAFKHWLKMLDLLALIAKIDSGARK